MRSAFAVNKELATGNRTWETRGADAPYVEFCMKMVRMLRGHGVVPVVRNNCASFICAYVVKRLSAAPTPTPPPHPHKKCIGPARRKACRPPDVPMTA